ncbi:hypothetical protein K523DRAFT_402039, partial [Schizophyllum commune Tattone D]
VDRLAALVGNGRTASAALTSPPPSLHGHLRAQRARKKLTLPPETTGTFPK